LISHRIPLIFWKTLPCKVKTNHSRPSLGRIMSEMPHRLFPEVLNEKKHAQFPANR
jgi:hypothetical protein